MSADESGTLRSGPRVSKSRSCDVSHWASINRRQGVGHRADGPWVFTEILLEKEGCLKSGSISINKGPENLALAQVQTISNPEKQKVRGYICPNPTSRPPQRSECGVDLTSKRLAILLKVGVELTFYFFFSQESESGSWDVVGKALAL